MSGDWWWWWHRLRWFSTLVATSAIAIITAPVALILIRITVHVIVHGEIDKTKLEV